MKNLYPCTECKTVFSTKGNLTRHLNEERCKRKGGIIEICEDKNENENENECEYCHKLFIKKSKLNRHLQSVQGECYKIRNGNNERVIKKKKIIKQIITNNYNNYNNCNNFNNITNIAIQPVVKHITLAKHGEETISHITKEIMLELLALESFTKMSTQLAKLLYFNDDVPQNKNWSIVYPKNKNAGVQLNEETNVFERILTERMINKKFVNMIGLFLPMIEVIDKEDQETHNLTWLQRSNLKKFTSYFGITNISSEAKYIYDSIKEMAYNERTKTMKTWKEGGHEGNHLSLKF